MRKISKESLTNKSQKSSKTNIASKETKNLKISHKYVSSNQMFLPSVPSPAFLYSHPSNNYLFSPCCLISLTFLSFSSLCSSLSIFALQSACPHLNFLLTPFSCCSHACSSHLLSFFFFSLSLSLYLPSLVSFSFSLSLSLSLSLSSLAIFLLCLSSCLPSLCSLYQSIYLFDMCMYIYIYVVE